MIELPYETMSIFSRLRLKFFIARRSMGFTSDYLERLYAIFLNHTKIIHWRDGHPVYSLSTPPLYSKPMGNFLARQMFRTIQNKNLPNLMSFAVNDDCNAACKHCSFFTGVDDQTKQVFSTDEAMRVIREAQEIGVSTINIVGGEPTLREDLADLIGSVDKDLTQVIMFTNGSLLKELAGKLKKAGLDGVYVSIDWATAEKHDKHRIHKGLFEKALAGIAEAKRVGLTVGISTCMTPESTADGEFERMVDLGKKLGVHEIIVFDAMPTGRFKFRKDLIDNPDWVEDLILRSKRYNADESYPGILVWGYATSHRSVGCTCGTSYFYMSPYGDIMSCDFNHAAFGNIREKPLFTLWDGLTTKKEFCSAKWGGCKIKDSATRDGVAVTAGKGCSGC